MSSEQNPRTHAVWTEMGHHTDNVTRMPCTSPRQVMEMVAQLCGGTLGLGMDGKGQFPEMRMQFGTEGRQEAASLDVRPELRRGEDGDQEMVIRTRVGWPSITGNPDQAAVALTIMQVAVQKAVLAQSVANHRSWKDSDILGGDDDDDSM